MKGTSRNKEFYSRTRRAVFEKRSVLDVHEHSKKQCNAVLDKRAISRGALKSGFTLLEVLIALFILSIGLLAIAELEVVALRRNHLAYQQSVAVQQISSGSERFLVGNKASELVRWNIVNANLLPHGEGKEVAGNLRPTICWYERSSDATKCM